MKKEPSVPTSDLSEYDQFPSQNGQEWDTEGHDVAELVNNECGKHLH